MGGHRAALPRCQELLRIIAFAPRPDYAAVAAALGMPVGSIGPTRGRCLAKLRALLADDPDGSLRMTPPEPGRLPSADEPLDDADFGAARTISASCSRPWIRCPPTCPSGSDSPSRCATWRSRWPGSPRRTSWPWRPGARSRAGTITFDSDSLTIMIRIDANRDGTVRVDGWLAPPQRREIEMKTTADPLTAASDEQGRFAFARVPRGTAQLIVQPAEPGLGRHGRSVVTPALII